MVRISRNLARNYVGYRLQIGEGMAGRVAATGEPMVLADYSMWPERAPVYEGEPLEQMLSVPLKWQDRVRGVINLHRAKSLPLLNQGAPARRSVPAQAAIALENPRLLAALSSAPVRPANAE